MGAAYILLCFRTLLCRVLENSNTGVNILSLVFEIKWHVKAQWMDAAYILLCFPTLLSRVLENSNNGVNI